MKLHLPSSLRKALLACLAALVVPSFTTLASGSSLLGAAVFSYLAASSVAQAEVLNLDELEFDNAFDASYSVPTEGLTVEGINNNTHAFFSLCSGADDDSEVELILGSGQDGDRGTAKNLTFGLWIPNNKPVKLVVDMGTDNAWQTFVDSYFGNIDFRGEGQIVLKGSSFDEEHSAVDIMGTITNGGNDGDGKGHLVIDTDTHALADYDVSVGRLDMRSNSKFVILGNLKVNKSGIMCGDEYSVPTGITLEVGGNITLAFNTGITSTLGGTLTMTGDENTTFTKKGSGLQTIKGLVTLQNVLYNDGGLTFEAGGSARKFDFDHSYDINRTLTLGGDFTVRELYGKNNENNSSIVYAGEGDGITFRIESDISSNETANIRHAIFGEKVKLVINSANAWAVFTDSSFYDIEIEAGEIDLRSSTVHGNVTTSAAAGVKSKLTVGASGTVTLEGNVTLHGLDLRGGSTTNIWGDLVLTEGGIDNSLGNNETLTVGKVADDGTVSGGNVSVTIASGSQEFKSGTTFTAQGLFTKKGDGTQKFSGTANLNGGLTVNGGTMEFVNTTTIDGVTLVSGNIFLNAAAGSGWTAGGMSGTAFAITGDVSMESGTSFTMGRGILLLGDGTVFDGTLTINNSSTEDSNKTLLAVGELTAGGSMTIKSLEVAAGNVLYVDHPGIGNAPQGKNRDQITIQDAVDIEGKIIISASKFTLSKGGALTGGVSLNWTASLVLGDDLLIDTIEIGSQGGAVERMEGVDQPVHLLKEITEDQGASNSCNSGITLDNFKNLYKASGSAKSIFDNGCMTVGVGVGVNFASTVTVYHIQGGGTLDCPLRINGGTLTLSSNSSNFDMRGAITGTGGLEIWTEQGNWSDPPSLQVKISGGGDLEGLLKMNSWGSRLTLASDFEVGGIQGAENLSSWGDEQRWRIIDSEGDEQRTLTLDVADGAADIDADVWSLTFGGNILLHKTGAGTQRIKDVSFGTAGTDSVDIWVDDGELIIGLASGATLTGDITVTNSGSLKFMDASGNVTDMANSTVDGNFTWDKNDAEDLGALTVTGTLTVGSLVPDLSTDDPDDSISRAETNVLSLHYNHGASGTGFNGSEVIKRYLSDIKVESGTLDISMAANGGRDNGAMTYFTSGTLSGEGEGGVLKLRRTAASNAAANYTAVLQLNPNNNDAVTFNGTLAFADDSTWQTGNASYTYAAAELSLAHGNLTLGGIDTTEASGAIGFTAGTEGAAQTIDVLRAIKGTHNLRFGRSSSGVTGAASPFANEGNAVVGVVNLREAGTISGHLYLGNLLNGALRTDSITLNIGNGKTLSVGGLAGYGGGGIGVWDSALLTGGPLPSDAAATILITGTGASMQHVNIASNVTLRLANNASQTFATATAGLVGGIELGNNSTLTFGAGTYTIKEKVVQTAVENGGSLTDAGNFEVKGSAGVTLEKGAEIGGYLWVSGGATLYMGADVTAGGLSAAGVNRAFIESSSTVVGNVTLTLDVAANETYTLTVGGGEFRIGSTTENGANNNLAFVKKGAGTQAFGSYMTVYGKGGAHIQDGVLEYKAGGTIKQHLWGDGTVVVSGGTLTLTAPTVEFAGQAEENYLGDLEVKNGVVQLDRNLTVHDLRANSTASSASAGNRVSHSGTATTLTIDVAQGEHAGNVQRVDETGAPIAGSGMAGAAGSVDDWHLYMSGVTLVKAGDGTYSLRGLTTTGDVQVTGGTLELAGSTLTNVEVGAGSTLLVDYGTAAGNTTLSGSLQVAATGLLQVNAATLSLTQAANADFTSHTLQGKVDLTHAGVLELGANMQVAGLLSNASTTGATGTIRKVLQSGSATDRVGADVDFTIHVANAADTVYYGWYNNAENTNAALRVLDGVRLVKTGAGTQVLHNLAADEVEVTDGALRLGVGNYDSSAWGSTNHFALGHVSVAGSSAALELGKAVWNAANGTDGSGTRITLSGGASLKSVWSTAAMSDAESNINLGTLELGATTVNDSTVDGYLVWSAATAADTTESWDVYKLTGKGNLEVGSSSGHGDKVLNFALVDDLSGTLSGGDGDVTIYVGTINQTAAAGQGAITAEVYSENFRKTGDGDFSITHLTVGTAGGSGANAHLYMDYTGTLDITTLDILSGATLHYTTGLNTNLLNWEAEKLLGIGGVYVDISELLGDNANNVLLANGISLGITGKSEGYTIEELRNHLRLVSDLSDVEWDLAWGDNDDYLYLKVTGYKPADGVSWDSHWGLELRNNVPNDGDMARHAISTGDLSSISGSANEFTEKVLALVGNSNYDENASRTYIKLTAGDTAADTKATVVGGAVYNSDAVSAGRVERNSFILLEAETGHYHMLVGGSSCVQVAASDTGAGAFMGNTHIEMKKGSVDYVIGANHVTNKEFGFAGDTYISIDGGTVLGGVVGGSTLTRGAQQPNAGQRQAIEFLGNSRLFIYTPMSNVGTTPGITTGSNGEHIGFAAVVGGNAWIEMPSSAASAMSPLFRGSSSITIALDGGLYDMFDTAREGNFDKAIVGGNYTAAFTGSDANGDRSTRFEAYGDGVTYGSQISIYATDGAVFSGGVNGASRRASGGSGATLYTGDTMVQVHGGTYTEAIAGGFWFESTAVGSHESTLTGNTNVVISDGRIWRVAGGSYSLGGGADSVDIHVGNSSVSITGGSFDSSYGGADAEGQLTLGFIAGGDFYRNNAGGTHSRTGNTSVSITGGDHFDGIHIVGGDYANFYASSAGADGADASSTITGVTSVTLGGNDQADAFSITGFVVGGSYLTDQGKRGSITIEAAEDAESSVVSQVTIGSGVTLRADESADHDHAGIAAVAGSAIVIERGTVDSTGHSALIDGDTSLVLDGGTVLGHLVGGSYTNEAAGTNSLSITGTVNIDLLSGSVTGNVYGGHYSQNTDAPDELTLHDVKIQLQGASVQGNIIGGSHREATVALTDTPPTQGSITIDLVTGRLTGSVYAAGEHTAAGGEALHVTTAATTVNVHADFVFEGGLNGAAQVVSGGYSKANAADASTVNARNGSTGGANLVFVDADGIYEMSGVSFYDFDRVVNAGDVVVYGDFRVLDRGASTTLRKEGAGHLSLLGGLHAADGSAYTGKLVLSGGSLALGDDLDLDQMEGVVFDLTGRTGNTRDTAWLQSDGGLLQAGGSANIEFTAAGTGFKLRMGSYFLIDELNGGNVGNRSFEDFFAALADDYFSSKGWLNDGEKAVVEMRDGSVVLRVFKDDPNEWYWQGGDAEHEQVWDGTSDNWSREGENGESVDLTTDDDVHFNAGASSTDVQITGTVSPRDIYVDSGDYTFTQKDGDAGEGIAMDGILHVGSGEAGDVASVSLELENKMIPKVELNTYGSLTLGAEGAIQHVDNVEDELSRTQIDFNGGTLVYGELADGSGLAFSADVSSQVVETHFVGSTISGVDDFIVRIQVGNSTAGNLDLAAADGAADEAPLQVVWDEASSGDATNWGIQHILTRGIEKSGRGELTVKWTIGDADAHAYDDNIISSVEGLLVLEATVDSTDTSVSIGGSGVIGAYNSGSVQLVIGGDATLEISRAFAGTGTVIIGAEGEGNYVLSGSRPTFAGCIQLLGNSSTDSAVLVKVVDALGGKDATLELHGRSLQLSLDDAVADASAPVQLGVGTIRVADDTLNYVSGTAAGEEIGLELTGALQGSGTLAAAGSVSHVLSGDLTGFDGTLHTADSNTVWRLAGTIADSGDVAINYTGSGSVVVDMSADTVRLVGVIAGSVNVENVMADTTLIIAGDQNTSTGSLVFNGNTIQLGDAEHAAVWKGVNLTGTGGGTFVLAHGTLQGSMTSGNKGMVSMRVETLEDIEGVGSGVGSQVDLGGNMGSLLDEVYIKAGGRLTGVTGDMTAGTGANTSFHLVLTGNNFHSYSSTNAADYLISAAAGSSASITIGDDGAGFVIDFSTDGLVNLLLAMREQDVNGSDGRAFLHLLYGGSLNFSQQLERALEVFMQGTAYGQLLTDLGFKFDMLVDSQAGEMAITGSSRDVYLVLEDGDAKGDASTVTKDNKADLAGKKATVVAPDATLDIVLSGDDLDPNATVNNLVGVGGGTLHATNTNPQTGDVTIELNNSLLSGSIDGAGTDHGGLDDVEQVRGQNTTFEGTILGDEGVNFRKTGSGTLTVGRGDGLGGMDVEGSLVLKQGRLNVEGDRQGLHNEVGALEFAYEDESAKGEQRGFRFAYGTTTTHDIVENSDPDHSGDDLIIIEHNGKLIYDHDDETEGSKTLTSTSWQGDGTGTFTVQDSDLTLDSEGSATTRVDGVNIELTDDGSLHLVGGTEAKDSSVTVQSGSSLTLEDESALTGQSDLDVWADASVTLTNGSHVNSSGSLTLHNDGTLTVDETSSLQMTGGATIDGELNLGNSLGNELGGLSGSGTINGTGANLTVVGEGNSFGGTLGGWGQLTVDRHAELELNGVSADGSGSVWGLDNEGRLTIDVSSSDTTLGDVHLGSKSDTTLRVNTDGRSSGGGLNMSEFTWEDGASLTIESVGSGSFMDDHIDLGHVDSELARTDGLDIQLSGAAFLHYDAGELTRDNSGHLSLGLTLVRENRFLNGQMDKNEMAGADMFWNASNPLSANWRHLTNDIFTAMDSDLYRMVDGLSTMHAQGRTAELGKALAAGAGASISVLGSALSQDVERQLKSIRNRTVGMSPETVYDGYDLLPEYHVWLHGEGSYHKLDADGTAPGYSLNSWGGTLGMDAQVSRDTTVGVALSAMYGNLKANAPDTANGNLDTTYLSAFARVADGAWLHTFVMTGGVANVKLDRTVNYGSGSYRTNGSTDGYALAALYEVGYSHVMNAEGTSILQTVFNAQFRHATISGYTESGSDAGLKVDDISHNVFTLGAGVRTQSMVGETALNRSAIFEARALVKADIGDRSGTAMNQLINGDGTARELESAEIGAVGIEIGAGLTVPLGTESGSIFMDVSAEMRRGYTNASGSVGYRFSF